MTNRPDPELQDLLRKAATAHDQLQDAQDEWNTLSRELLSKLGLLKLERGWAEVDSIYTHDNDSSQLSVTIAKKQSQSASCECESTRLETLTFNLPDDTPIHPITD